MLSKINVLLRLVVSIILLQSLYFKFSGHPEAVHIFSTLGVEPWGRYILGGIELITGIALLVPKTKITALFATVFLMFGALGSHLCTPLGIVVEWDGKSDHGQLFIMAIIAFIFSLTSIILYCKIKKCSMSQLISLALFKTNL
jgi:putative oxidoreductase